LEAASNRQDSRAGRTGASRRVYPLHPFLFAGSSVLTLLAHNLNQATFADVAPALVGVLALAGGIYLLVAALRRRFDAATAVVASIWVVGAVYYIDLFRPLNRLLDGGYPMVRSLPFAAAALGLLTFGALRLGRATIMVHTLLNGVALVMLALPAWQVVAYEWHNGAARAAYDPDQAAAAMPQIAAPVAAGARPPDIYHFVFDRYPADESLERFFGVEGNLGRFLEDRGFYVARASNSNYLKTGPSLASTFYMDYLDLLATDPRVKGENWQPIFEMLGDHRVARFLHTRGYDFLQFGGWWEGTYANPVAEENHPLGFSEFAQIYFRHTVLRPIFHALPDSEFTSLLDWDNAQCQRVKEQVEMIKSVGRRGRPVYVFVHMLLPHGPFVFAADGRCLTHEESEARGARQGYLDQVEYAGSVIRELVTSLQAADPEPVILMQSDEGPYPNENYNIVWEEASPDQLRLKTAILNAYYFPNRDYHLLRPDITPVNSYRVLFNTYFDAGLPILPDRIYGFPRDTQIYAYRDITAAIRGDTASMRAGTGVR
jgi:hypothetical protein